MNARACIEFESGDQLVGKVEKLTSKSLFISFDKKSQTTGLSIGNRYMVSIISQKAKCRLPCNLIRFDSDLVYFKPLRTHPV